MFEFSLGGVVLVTLTLWAYLSFKRSEGLNDWPDKEFSLEEIRALKTSVKRSIGNIQRASLRRLYLDMLNQVRSPEELLKLESKVYADLRAEGYWPGVERG